MDGHERARLAVVVVTGAGRLVSAGPVERAGRCDLGLVDDLLRLRLRARRNGWSVWLCGAHPNLSELLDLVGFDASLDPM